MFHELLRSWFELVEHWGYAGVFLLMALESTIVPVPSEVVMPPAAFWAAQGRMSFAGVVLAGTLGSFLGSILNYYVSQWIGTPVLKRYGKYVLLSEDTLRMAEAWVREFGVVGIFVARLLPVVRHVISIPAGILKMPVGAFSAATLVGAGLWCWVLAWFGAEVIGSRPDLLDSPEAMVSAVKAKVIPIALAALAFGALYGFVHWYRRRTRAKAEGTLAPEVNSL